MGADGGAPYALSGSIAAGGYFTLANAQAQSFLSFTADESCGKCAPCREGTKQMLRILTRICQGNGTAEDLTQLKRLANTVKSASLCGLGSTAPNPVLTAIRYFPEEFDAHVCEKTCPAGVCQNLITLRIDQQLCTGCEQCTKVCPVGAIHGEPKTPHRIDPDTCFRYWATAGTDCGVCMRVCPYSHPDSTAHNLVRWAIRSSGGARRILLWADDLFYRKRPALRQAK